jgi:hypothetical protein
MQTLHELLWGMSSFSQTHPLMNGITVHAPYIMYAAIEPRHGRDGTARQWRLES